jgi:hypothetical protein
MKKLGFSLLSFVLFFSFFLYQRNTNNNSKGESARKIAALPLPDGKGGEIQGQIYQYKWPLSFPPIRFFAMRKIKKTLKKMISDLPLEEGVAKRVKKHLSSKNLRKNILPFLLAVKKFYIPSKEKMKFTFKKHIKEAFPNPKAVPGLEHSLFSYEEKSIKKEGVGNTNSKLFKLAATGALTLYDAIIIQDPNFKLGKKPVLTAELEKRVQRTVVKLLGSGIAELGEDHPISKKLKFFIDNPIQIKAMASTGIDAVHKYVYELHHMFALGYHRRELLDKWLRGELRKPNQGELWNYLDEVSNNDRYAVHYVVDGLQGRLIRELSEYKEDKQFFKQIYSDYQNREYFKPNEEMKPDTGKDRQVDFLKYIKQSNFNYENPSYLPFFKSLYRENNEGIVEQGLSTSPTLSGRNIPVAQSGAPVYGEGSTGLPNFNFLDREDEHAYYWLGNQAFLISRYSKEYGMKSLFERLPHLYGMNCSSVYMEGMNLKVDGYLTVTLGEKKRDYGEILCHFEMKKRVQNFLKLKEYYAGLHKLKGRLKRRRNPAWFKAQKYIKKIVELSQDSIPQYLLIYNVWPDHFSHYTGPFSDEVISPTGELNRLDFWVGQMMELYKKAGVYDSTLWGMAGDHGLAPTYYQIDPIKLFLDKVKSEGSNPKVERITISPDNPVLVDLNHRENMRGRDIVLGVTAGGSLVFDFFIDHKENWKTHPKTEDLRRIKFIDGSEVDVIKTLLTTVGESLDYFIVREGESNLNQADVRLMRRERGKDYSAFIKRKGNRIYYTYERDLLRISELSRFKKTTEEERDLYKKLLNKCVRRANKEDESSWCKEEEWILLESFTDRPGGVSQMAHLYDGGKAGTINIFPKLGISFNTYKIGRHGGDHFHEKDAFVGVWGTPAKKIFPRPYSVRSALNGSLPPTLFEYLSGDKAEKGNGDWGYKSLFKVYDDEESIKRKSGDF